MTLPARDEPRYWFKAKRYGWGWGLPSTWEGWIVLAVYLGVIVVAALVFGDSGATGIVALVATVLFVLIAARTGEPARWRWGNKD